MTYLNDVLPYAAAALALFISTLLRGFQNKNVAGGHRKLALVVGYAMSLSDMFVMALVVKTGWQIGFVAAAGAALGWYSSIVLHDRLVKRRLKQLKSEKRKSLREKKREKRRAEIQQMIRDEMSDLT